MKPKYIALIAATLATSMVTAQTTTKLTASKANNYGVAYTLPKTAFDIVIEAEMTERTPGEFSNYASFYLNADDAIKEHQFSTRILSITVIPRALPDPDNRWMLELKGSGLSYVMIDAADIPLAINTEDIVTTTKPQLPTPRKAEPTPLETEAAKQAMTREMLTSTSDSKRAQLAAHRIFELRDTRSDLISGNADNTPPDGQSMQLMLDNLSAQEAALNAMFVGTEKKWTDVKTFTYTPGKENQNIIIARISPVSGIVDADNLSGIPLTLDYKVLTTGQLPTDDQGEPKKAPKEGITYTIPGTAQLSLSFNNREVHRQQYEVSQLGQQFMLDSKLFTDKKSPYFLIFNPLTGGISKLGHVE